MAAAFWLCLWTVAYYAVHQDLLLASPWQVLRTLVVQAREAFFWQAVLHSLGRTLLAIVLGILLGILLAVLAALSPTLATLISPALTVIRATPVTSFIILALVWLSSQWVPVLTGIIMVLPIVFGNVLQGILDTDRRLLEMARMYGLGRWGQLRHVIAPSVAPTLWAACETSLGLCWKATIAAEVLGVPKMAIGTQLYQSKIYLQTDKLLAYTLVVILLSILMERLLQLLIRRLRRIT